MITNSSHVAIQVTDVEAAVDHATHVMGLREVESVDGRTYLTHGGAHSSHTVPHHALELSQGSANALDHLGFEVDDATALAELKAHLEDQGLEVSGDQTHEPGLSEAIRFEGPDGHVFQVSVPMEVVPRVSTTGPRVRSFGHAAVKTGGSISDTAGFLTTVLGFAESDFIGANTPDGYQPIFGFYRCNEEHHAIAALLGEPGLYHYAFEVDSIRDLMELGDCLDRAGRQVIWGPGRHGAGDNIALYHHDASGIIVEHYCDMQAIVGGTWQARRWDVEDYRSMNTWGGTLPDPSIFEQGIPLLRPAHSAAA